MTRRTNFRKAFLGPWHELVSDIFFYALADAQRVSGVELHHSTIVVNHHHTDFTPTKDNVPEFTARFHRDVSCGVNQLLVHERYDAPGYLFDARQPHCMRLLDAEAQGAHLTYGYINNVTAGLVRRPDDMPGARFRYGLWRPGAVMMVKRPPIYFGKDRPSELPLVWTPPPLLYQSFGGDIDGLIHAMEMAARKACKELERARKRANKTVLGAKGVRRIHAWDETITLRQSGGQRVPTFKLGAKGLTGRRARIKACTEVTDWRAANRAQVHRFRDGHRDEPFPFGTYGMRRFYGANVKPAPDPGAILLQPGPTLAEVRQVLRTESLPNVLGRRAAQRSQALAILDIDDREQESDDNVAETAVADETGNTNQAEPAPVDPTTHRRTITANINRAFSEEVDELIACDDMTFSTKDGLDQAEGTGETADPAAGAENDNDRSPPLVRHRFDRINSRDDDAAAKPSRIIVRRDARRGRPKRVANKKHGSDPPQ